MYWIVFVLGIFLSVVLEASGVALPWSLMLLFLTTVFMKKEWLFFTAIPIGIVLDSVTFRFFGISSLFFLCFLGMVFVYERKFETQSLEFVVGSIGLGSLAYFLLFGSQNILLQIVLTIGVSTAGFFGITFFLPRAKKW